jgi:hypothetical protein
LSFGGVPERVLVPFDAVTAFFDPAVQFGFQFETIEGEAAADADSGQTAEKSTGTVTRLPAEESKPDSLPAPSSAAATNPTAPPPDGTTSGGGEVVRLDRFRKK